MTLKKSINNYLLIKNHLYVSYYNITRILAVTPFNG